MSNFINTINTRRKTYFYKKRIFAYWKKRWGHRDSNSRPKLPAKTAWSRSIRSESEISSVWIGIYRVPRDLCHLLVWLCSLTCFERWSLRMNRLLHTGHENRFSPENLIRIIGNLLHKIVNLLHQRWLWHFLRCFFWHYSFLDFFYIFGTKWHYDLFRRMGILTKSHLCCTRYLDHTVKVIPVEIIT